MNERKSQAPAWATDTLVAGSPLFIEALRDNSNYEADWLWLAQQDISERERVYSLRQALAINPVSEYALRELARYAAKSHETSATQHNPRSQLQHI